MILAKTLQRACTALAFTLFPALAGAAERGSYELSMEATCTTSDKSLQATFSNIGHGSTALSIIDVKRDPEKTVFFSNQNMENAVGIAAAQAFCTDGDYPSFQTLSDEGRGKLTLECLRDKWHATFMSIAPHGPRIFFQSVNSDGSETVVPSPTPDEDEALVREHGHPLPYDPRKVYAAMDRYCATGEMPSYKSLLNFNQ